MRLIIQIPVYNEEATIGRTLADLPRRIDGISFIETLIIDDGSTDNTVDAARRAGVKHVVRLLNHRGLSTAFTAGIDAALRLGADIIVNTDGDNQYRGSDITALIQPILRGNAEVVIGDRDVKTAEHMSPAKRFLQQFGSWAVGIASGVKVPDVTSGFRAFSREAAYQINVFNPFTYTLETIIQAGNRNLGVQTVRVGTNPPTRPSRLYRGAPRYIWKSIVTIFRIYTVYRPLKTFVGIGAVLFLAGVILGGRFLFYFFMGDRGGHIQSLILAAVLLLAGFQTALIGLVADLISVNRRLSEDVLVRLRKLEPNAERRRDRRPHERPQHQRRPDKPAQPGAVAPEPQWVWLLDETKLETRENRDELAPPPGTSTSMGTPGRRRRRRRRGSMRGPQNHGAGALPPNDEE